MAVSWIVPCKPARRLKSKSWQELKANNSISIIVEPLKSDDNGMGPGALVIARDISDLRRAEAEAIAHKSFIASIADRTPDEIYALDPEGRITWMNERAEAYRLLMSRWR